MAAESTAATAFFNTISLANPANLGTRDSAGFFGGDLGEAGFDHFLDEGGRKGLAGWELDGAFGEGVGLQVVLELFDYASGGEDAAMFGESGEPDDDFAMTEGGNFVADGFGGVRRQSGADGRADFLQGGASGFGDGGEVGIDIFRTGGGSRRWTAFSRFLRFHPRKATGTLD
jgi:hypothetical protein